MVRTKAVLASKHRPRGAEVVVPMAVDRVAYKNMLLSKLVPAIVAKWPRDVKIINVQQNNAGPHVQDGANGVTRAGLLVKSAAS